MTNPYTALVNAGIPLDNHESDLYAKVTPEAGRIIRASGWGGVTVFINQLDGSPWFDLPFAYLPWWEARQCRGPEAVAAANIFSGEA